MGYHYTPITIVKILTNVGEDTEKHTHSDVSGRNGIWDSHSGRWIGIIL